MFTLFCFCNIECSWFKKKKRMSCKVRGCKYKDSHVTRAHLCGSCKAYGHGQVECHKPNERRKLEAYFGDILPQARHCSMAGCRYKESHTTQAHHCGRCLKNHSFVECPERALSVQCPECRKQNKVKISQRPAFVDKDCVVCLAKKAQVFFPECGHINCCLDCFRELPNK